jgi:hypothetical protein
MAFKKKGSHKNLYLTLTLVAIVVVGFVALYFATLPPLKKATVGVHVGDSFTYSITGISTLQSEEATVSPGFDQYNQTDYYKVSVTGITDTNVSLSTVWRFLNGTEVNGQLMINLTDGRESVENGFWAIYSANLKVGDPIRPADDRLTVNATDTKTYADSTRQRNYWFIENEFYDVNDPTHGTLRYDHTGVYFDKETGMLVILNNITAYNNPLKTEAITWKLISCTVWNV